ncbi:hypothetical protein WAF17_18280 [Bernardetia sp. ABR2-2B]|uniref:hypothetical protein n=1 Tax=Bernardetia sp. ABR2-2B TaxID=3127472 RepID=UPI0030D33893
MKITLFITFLLNFVFLSSLLAQKKEELGNDIKHSFPTSKPIIQLFENIQTQLKTESSFDKIEYQLTKGKLLNNTMRIKDTLDKELYFIAYTVMSLEEDFIYNSQFLV